MHEFETLLLLLLACTGIAVLGRKAGVPIPVAMVLGGLGIALVPGLHMVQFDPDVTFAIFVPPLLFRAAITTSARGLRSKLRSVTMLAVGLVTATACAVAWAGHALLGMPWAPAFVLGAIVSPPDAVVSIALARALRLPRAAIALIEGETLLNDTTAFVLYRQALAAAVTGSFALSRAVPQFVLVGGGGALVGAAVALLIRWTRQHLQDPILENVVWLLAPFLCFLPAEALGASGVLAVVVAGLLLRQWSPLRVSAQTRIQANHVYDLVEFILNSLIFVLIGLQVGGILRAPGGLPLRDVVRGTALITAVVVGVRIVWMFAGAYGPRMLSARIRRNEPLPAARVVSVMAWMGMRGGDSLVTALAVPLVVASGAPFPFRSLIVSVTFGVILATLLLQGLTLRPLIRLLRIPADSTHEQEEQLARERMTAAGSKRLEQLLRDGKLPRALVESAQAQHDRRSALEHALAAPEGASAEALQHKRIEEELLHARRAAVVELRNQRVIDDEVLRHLERELDLEEMRLALTGGDGAE